MFMIIFDVTNLVSSATHQLKVTLDDENKDALFGNEAVFWQIEVLAFIDSIIFTMEPHFLNLGYQF